MPSHATERIDTAAPPPLTAPRETERAITTFVRETVDEADADGVVVCLSGGIDSTVSATLAVEALHRHSVYGLVLPADPTRETAVEDARSVAESLGIEYRILDVQPILDRFVGTAATDQTELKPNPFKDRVRRISTSPVERANYREAVGNTAARIRMSVAYFEANTTNRLVLGTGNRTELLLGYFTKYGDGGVDLLPIGDCYKAEVRQLARHLGIPRRIVEKPPSAGLWAGQTDEAELGASYETIDAVLRLLVDDGRTVEGVAGTLDLDQETVTRYADMVERAEHKRTTPPTPADHGSPPTVGGASDTGAR